MNLKERSKFKKILENTKLPSLLDKVERYDIIQSLNKNAIKFLPNKLYRYRNFNQYSLNDLKTFTISSSKPSKFDDKNDSLIYINEKDFIKSVCSIRNKIPLQNWVRQNLNLFKHLNKEQQLRIKSLANDSHASFSLFLSYIKPRFEKELPFLIEEAKTYLKNYPYIVCLTDNKYSNQMWQNYGDNYRGFIIEYDYKNYMHSCLNCPHEQKCLIKHYEVIFPIIYTSEKFEARSFLLKYFKEKYSKYFEFANKIPIDDELAFYKIMLYKLPEFSFESEWRIISTCIKKPQIRLKPSAIYAGKNMTTQNFKWLINYCTTNNISLYKMEEDIENMLYSEIML